MVSPPNSGLSRLYSRAQRRLQQETLVAMPKVTDDAGAIRLLHDLDDLGIALQPFVLLANSQLAKTAAELDLLLGRQIPITKKDHLVVEHHLMHGRKFLVAERLREIDA